MAARMNDARMDMLCNRDEGHVEMTSAKFSEFLPPPLFLFVSIYSIGLTQPPFLSSLIGPPPPLSTVISTCPLGIVETFMLMHG